jgi:hypothetical protein
MGLHPDGLKFDMKKKKHPAFNHKNQGPDWKKAVIIWNANHAKKHENNIFYKVCSLV